MLELEVSKVKIGKYLRALGTSTGMWVRMESRSQTDLHSAEGSRRYSTVLTTKASL